MKKCHVLIRIVFFTFILTAGFYGCGGDSGSGNPDETAPAASADDSAVPDNTADNETVSVRAALSLSFPDTSGLPPDVS